MKRSVHQATAVAAFALSLPPELTAKPLFEVAVSATCTARVYEHIIRERELGPDGQRLTERGYYVDTRSKNTGRVPDTIFRMRHTGDDGREFYTLLGVEMYLRSVSAALRPTTKRTTEREEE